MDRRLQLIAHLYEEDIDGLVPLDSLLEDPELRQEYRLLREARFSLDHRDRAMPDPGAVDAVLGALARPAPVPADRAPLRLVRMRRYLAPVMAVAATILIVVFVSPLPWDGADMAGSEAQTAAEAADVPDRGSVAESLLRSLPPAAPAVAPVAALGEAEEAVAKNEAGVPSWDSGRDVRLLSRRIAELRAAGIDAWDGPAVPLEMPPDGSFRTDLRPAAARQPRQ